MSRQSSLSNRSERWESTAQCTAAAATPPSPLQIEHGRRTDAAEHMLAAGPESRYGSGAGALSVNGAAADNLLDVADELLDTELGRAAQDVGRPPQTVHTSLEPEATRSNALNQC